MDIRNDISESLQKAFLLYREKSCLNDLTFKEVLNLLENRNQMFVEMGLLPGDRIIIQSTDDKHTTIINILAALLYNYIPVILPNKSELSFLEECSTRVGAKLILGLYANKTNEADSSIPIGYENTTLIIGTSGTTGTPKLIAHSDKSILTNINGIRSYIFLAEGENILVIRSPANLSVLTNEILLGIFSGCHIHTYEDVMSPLELVKSLSSLKINYLVSVPTFINFAIPYLERFRENLSQLRYIKCVGEIVNIDTIDKVSEILPNVEVLNCYGLTETGPRLTWLSSKKDVIESYSVGKPIPGVEIRIVAENNTINDSYEKGIVQISTDSMMIGYWGNPPFIDRWFSTLDWGWLNENGFLFVEGRYDDLIIRGGINIPPAVIENVLLKHPQVIDAAVGYKKENYNIEIHAFVVVSKCCVERSDALLRWSREQLSREYWIQRIYIVDDLQRNQGGKVNRKKLFNGVEYHEH